MCYEIVVTEKFKEDIKYYKKKKKYVRITSDLQEIVEEVRTGNLVGTPIEGLQLPIGENSYKVRAVNTDMKVGKSNGYRVIYYVIKDDKIAYMLSVYSKKDDSRVLSDAEIKELIIEHCT